MHQHTIRLILVATTVSVFSTCLSAQDFESKALTTALTRGLSYLQKSGTEWKESRGCVSCHQIPPMLLAMQLAKRQGHIQFEQTGMKLGQWEQWSTDVVNFVKPEQKATCNQQETMTGNIDTMAGLLLAILPNEKDSWRTRMAEHLVTQQAEDGTWNPCGQLPAQRRTIAETRLATTLWVARSLIEEGQSFNRRAIEEHLSQLKSAESTEVLALRLLNSHSFTSLNRKTELQNLLETQNADGGWGWKRGEPTDALGTAFADYAISKTGPLEEEADTVAFDRAIQCLLMTQNSDGGWLVPGTKKSAKGRTTQTANDWGTAWAIIALLQHSDRLRHN